MIPQSASLRDIVAYLISLVNVAVPVLVTIAVVIFFLGLVRYIYRTGGGAEKEQDKQLIMWGLIALFVLVSLWGILRLLTNTFLGGYTSTPQSGNTPGYLEGN